MMSSIWDNISMIKFMPFVILISVNIIYGIIINQFSLRNRWTKIIGEFFVFMLILFYLYIAYTCTTCQDYQHYKELYESSFSDYNHSDFTKDKGFVYLGLMFNKLGFDFKTFRLFMYILLYGMMYFSLCMFKADKNLTLGLYSIFPWCFNAFQMRTGLGLGFAMMAATGLLLGGKKKILGILIFLLFIILGYSVHGSTLIYAVFILVFFTFKNKNYIVLGTTIISFALLLSFYFNGSSTIKYLIPEQIYYRFFSRYTVNVPAYREYNYLFKAMCYELFAAASALFAFRQMTFKKEFINISINDYSKEKDYSKVKILFYMSLCMFAILPLITLNLDLFRLERCFMIFIYIMITISIRNARWKILNPFNLLALFFAGMAFFSLFSFTIAYEHGGAFSAFWVFFIK